MIVAGVAIDLCVCNIWDVHMSGSLDAGNMVHEYDSGNSIMSALWYIMTVKRKDPSIKV